MKKCKKIISLFMAAFMILTVLPANVFAQELNADIPIIPEVQNYSDENANLRVPNFIPISVTARTDGTGVDVHVGNVGVDGLDSVTVTVSATGHSGSKSQTSYVPPIIGKTFSFNMPMIKCNTTYNATIRIVDGSGTVTKTGKATLNYSDSTLQSAGWHKGTFSTRAASLEYHFGKHKGEIGATNLVFYLNMAANYRAEIVNDIASGTTGKYTITTGTGSIPSKKYKHKTDKRFAILTNSGYEILSFGK